MAALLTVCAIHATAVEVPMARPLGTSAQTMRTAPLLLIDLETEEGITGRAYLFCYTRMAPWPIAAMLADIQDAVRGECLAPVDLSTRLQQHYRLLGHKALSEWRWRASTWPAGMRCPWLPVCRSPAISDLSPGPSLAITATVSA
jgi:hypothetical protein